MQCPSDATTLERSPWNVATGQRCSVTSSEVRHSSVPTTKCSPAREIAWSVADSRSPAWTTHTGGSRSPYVSDQSSWVGQIFRNFPELKAAYVADWDELPKWQQETDADIFEYIATKF
jgi:hypothetical protein